MRKNIAGYYKGYEYFSTQGVKTDGYPKNLFVIFDNKKQMICYPLDVYSLKSQKAVKKYIDNHIELENKNILS